MGIVASFMDRRVGAELNERGVLVWYDPARAWQPWVQAAHGESLLGEEATVAQVTIGGRDAHLVISTGSHYEVLQACEPLLSGSEPSRLLVYVPGEPYLETLSPLRELECLGGEKEPYQRELTQVARQALQSAGLSESKIDELLNRDGLDFAYLDSISVGDEGASPLAPVFGSSRELDVLPSFLAEPGRRAEAEHKGLLPEVAQLVSQGLGLRVSDDADAEAVAQELARALLVAEMRSDLDGPEPVAISQIRGPHSDDQVERVRTVCRKLRLEHPGTYEALADTVEQELGLAQAEIDPETLGHIDTFRFEERSLLGACDRLLVSGKAARALELVEARSQSFWTSIGRFPARHADWQACGELARLAIEIERVSKQVRSTPANASRWVTNYTRADGWHLIDQRHRRARHLLAGVEQSETLEAGSMKVFASYNQLLERMTTGFAAMVKGADWASESLLHQTSIYNTRVAKQAAPVAYLLVDALRYEMAIELKSQLEAVGATEVHLEPAIAAVPTITDVGMVALLPGAELRFSIEQVPKGIAGSVGGVPHRGSPARMDYAKGAIPGLVEMSMDSLSELSSRKVATEVANAPVVVIRSTEIDGAGERLPNEIARLVMTMVLAVICKAVRALANAGVEQFVVTADHGHLFGSKLGDDMKIDPPAGGTCVDLHRRCWIGRGGDTPSSCLRLIGRDLGYDTDLDIVVPKGTGVFKPGGDLAYHHGGLSLQELIVPVLTFSLEGREAAKRSKTDLLLLKGPKQVTNRIFSVGLTSTQLKGLDPLRLRVLAVSADHGTPVGRATFATSCWDADRQTVELTAGGSVDVGLQLEDEEVQELRVLVVEVGTERVLKDTQPIPVNLLR